MNGYNKNTKYATLGKWTLIEPLGSGATSRVFLGYDPHTHKHAAVKILLKVDSKSLPDVRNEAYLQSVLKHENLINILEFHETITLIDAQDRTQSVTAIVLELGRGGDILYLIENIGIFPERLARTYFHQLVEVLDHLQKNEVAHRDIKPDNILLDNDFCVKLADFGCASKISPGKKPFKAPAGTSRYFPPEVHVGLPYEGLSTDMFATAMVVFCMTIGHMPFASATESDALYNFLLQGKIKTFWKTHEDILKEQGHGASINSDFKDLFTRLFEPNPSKRVTLEDVKKSAWYKGDILQRSEIAKVVRAAANRKQSSMC